MDSTAAPRVPGRPDARLSSRLSMPACAAQAWASAGLRARSRIRWHRAGSNPRPQALRERRHHAGRNARPARPPARPHGLASTGPSRSTGKARTRRANEGGESWPHFRPSAAAPVQLRGRAAGASGCPCRSAVCVGSHFAADRLHGRSPGPEKPLKSAIHATSAPAPLHYDGARDFGGFSKEAERCRGVPTRCC